MVDSIYKHEDPFLYFRHVHFVNFTKFTDDQSHPLYFTVAREPMSHFRSYYYYIRSETFTL